MKKKGLLKHIFVKVIFVLIAFFSLIRNSDAASFAYDAFKWDTFYEENVDYWTDYCESSVSEEKVDKCVDVTLNGKEKYYTKLYKVLADYEKNKGYKLNDNIIIATTFFYLTPDTFNDLPDEYLKEYETGEAYGNDDSDIIDSAEEEKKYLNGEVDEIKTLTKHMFSYAAPCKNENGDVIETYKLNYTEYLIAKTPDFIQFFGFRKDTYEKKCEEQGGKYDGPTGEKTIDYNTYWRYLEESEYFDRKVHLEYFYQDILEATNKKHMEDLTSTEKEKYAKEIKEARKEIVEELKSSLEMYDYEKLGPDSGSFINACGSGTAWWPIGSSETTVENGFTFAKSDPVTVTVSSPFGLRIHPVYKTRKMHTGIDIPAGSGVNIIAVKDGTVVLAGENGGYGQCVIIQHNDGTYSLYGHMLNNSITVSIGDSVIQGQVVGKVGSTGVSTGPHLHFEIRQGSNSSSSTVDPLSNISAENPRPMGGGICSGSSSEFTKMLHWFEGTGNCQSPTNGSNYVIHDDGYGYPTVGYGIALVHNIDRFKNYGYDVTNMIFNQELPIDIVDKVEAEEVNEKRTYVLNYLAKNNLTLTDYQIDSLTMIAYQFGNLGNLKTTYPQYGNTDALRQYTHNQSGSWHYFRENPSTANGRADANWKLFHEGIYTYGEACN